MTKKWDELCRVWEVSYPWVIPVVVTVLTLRVPTLAALIYKPTPEILTASLTVGSIYIAFVVTAASILMTVNAQAIQFLRDVDRLKDVLMYLSDSIRTSFYLVTVSMIILFLKDYQGQWYRGYWGVAWVLLVGVSVMTTYRATIITLLLMRKSVTN